MVQPSESENSEEMTSPTTSNEGKQDREESSNANSAAFRVKNVSEINATSNSEVGSTDAPSSSTAKKRQLPQWISSPQATEKKKPKQTSADECTSSSAPDEDREDPSGVNGGDILTETARRQSLDNVHSDNDDEIEMPTLKVEAEDKDEETGEAEGLVDPQPGCSNVNPATNQASSATEANVKTEPEAKETEEEEDIKPAVAVVTQEATSTSREACKYGIRCYRRNPQHRNEQSHPGDPDYRRPDYPAPPKGTPECPFGDRCYRRNPAHFQEYSHPPSS